MASMKQLERFVEDHYSTPSKPPRKVRKDPRPFSCRRIVVGTPGERETLTFTATDYGDAAKQLVAHLGGQPWREVDRFCRAVINQTASVIWTIVAPEDAR